jgi:hypothetical protein
VKKFYNETIKQILFGLFVGSVLLFVVACGGSSQKKEPLVQIKGDIVHDQNGRETTINGKVMVVDNYTLRSIMDLGTIENGKLNLELPDLGQIENASRLFSKVDFKFPKIEIEPSDTAWVKLDKAYAIFIFTDEDVPNGWGGMTKQNYLLELRDELAVVKVQLIYFSKDAVIKGKGNILEAYDYDIDLNAAKGWNMVYIRESGGGISMKTSEKENAGIKWTAAKTNRGL